MSAPVYFIAILTFIGWIFLVFFGGVGLFALPMDLIN
jgi:LMBR1 domain-containing protein 1